MTRRSSLAIGCVVALLLVLLICGGWEFYSSFNRADQVNTLVNFGNAMRANDAFRAKWFAAPEQWNRIDIWMSKHKGYSCPPFILVDVGWQSGGFFEKDTPYKGNIFMTDVCGGHKLDFHDIYLEQDGRDWIVVDIGQVCETGRMDVGICDPPK